MRESLERHCRANDDDSIDLTDEENLLVERFNVPVEWIYEAKALHAKYMKEHFKEAILLIRACQWNRAHQVILEHLAADSIIEGLLYFNFICAVINFISLKKKFLTNFTSFETFHCCLLS